MNNANGAYTSSATLNSILTTTASPTIPTKRKIRDVSPPYADPYPHPSLLPPASPYTYPAGSVRNQRRGNEASGSSSTPAKDVSSEAIDCICGFAIDDGFSIACDLCSRWCHSACFGIAQGGPVPDLFECWVCRPLPAQVKERAVQMQRARLGLHGGSGAVTDGVLGLGLTVGEDAGKQRRRLSPGTDRRARKGVVEGGNPAKRRRRPSVVSTPTIIQQTPSLPPVDDEEHVDIDAEPWTATYVPIAHDVVPDDNTRTKLRKHAQHWRGITAVSSCPPPSPPPIAIRPLPRTPSPLLSSTNTGCLPPSYAAYTTRPLPSSALITPFVSCITPSSVYLREPTNGYAHLGMPKPYVHLVGPPLGVALDARGVGGEGRFVRWGCRPNAVLRPIICKEGKRKVSKAGVRFEKKEKEKDETESEEEIEKQDATLGFAVFALRDLRAGEEVVLGWEWDDGHAIHRLPALLRAPQMFPHIPVSIPSTTNGAASTSTTTSTPPSQAELRHLKNQLSDILHALASTFTTCACGADARTCAVGAMAAVVEQLEVAGGLDSGFTARAENRTFWADDEGRQERSGYRNLVWGDVDLGPLVGAKRGFRTRERVPFSGGMGGMELVDEDESETGRDGDRSRRADESKKRRVNGRRGLPVKYTRESKANGKAAEGFSFSVVGPDGGSVQIDPKGKGKARVLDKVDHAEDVNMELEGSRAQDPSAVLRRSSTPKTATYASTVPSSHTQPILEPRPPDPPPASSSLTSVAKRNGDEDRMPPKMRKRWMHREVEKMGQQAHVSGRRTSSIERALEPGRTLTPEKTLARDQTLTLAPVEVEAAQKEVDKLYKAPDGRIGLGIRFDGVTSGSSLLNASVEHPTQNLSASPPQDSLHPAPSTNDQDLMPPPPMPAALDPTTVFSQRAHTPTVALTPTPSPPLPPHSTPTHTSVLAQPSHISTTHTLDPQSVVSAISPSPLTGFAKLSLLSPALVLDVQPPPEPFPPSPTLTTGEMSVDKEAEASEMSMVVDEKTEGVEPGREMEVEEDGKSMDQLEHASENVVNISSGGSAPEVSSTWSPIQRQEPAQEDIGMGVDVQATPVASFEVPQALDISLDAKTEHESRDADAKTISPTAVSIPEEPDIVKFNETLLHAPSPLDSMTSMPASRVSPLPDVSPPELVTKETTPFAEVPKAEDVTSEQMIPAPRLNVVPPDTKSSLPPSPALDSPSLDHVEDDEASPAPSIPLALIAAKTLPPDHFFDTDDEDEWKRQMEIDLEAELTLDAELSVLEARSPLPPPSPRSLSRSGSVSQEEVEDTLDGRRETEMGTPPRWASDDSKEGTHAATSLQYRTRTDSASSSRSASAAPVGEQDTTAMDVDVNGEPHEPPPPTASTVTEHDVPPPSAESISSVSPEADLGTFATYTQSPITHTPIPPGASSASPHATKSASPAPVDPPAPNHQASPSPVSATTTDATAHDTPPVHDQPSQPKVKLSLRDFVLRKKKQREEQQATSKSAQASPISTTSLLGTEDVDTAAGATVRSNAAPVTPASGAKDNRENSQGVSTVAAPSALNGNPQPIPRDLLSISVEAPRPQLQDQNLHTMVAVSSTLELVPPPSSTSSVVIAPNLHEVHPLLHEARRLRLQEQIPALVPSSSTPERTLTAHAPAPVPTTSWSPRERLKPESTEPANVDTVPTEKQPPAIESKSAEDFRHNSRRPSIVLDSLHATPIATTSAVTNAVPHLVNGEHLVHLNVPATSPLHSTLPPKPTSALPPLPPQYQPSYGYAYETREAKKELIDPPAGHLSSLHSHVSQTSPRLTSSHPVVPQNHAALDRSVSPISSDLALARYSRRPSQEDGEIEASPPLSAHRSLGRPLAPKHRPLSSPFTNPPVHSPPTGPRSSFHPPSASPTPSFNGGGSSYRPLQSSQSVPAIGNASANRPAPPSAPRALRQSMLSNKPMTPSAGNSSSTGPYYPGGPPHIPRGPSADRDRDRDRDWDARHYRGARRGGGGPGWSR